MAALDCGTIKQGLLSYFQQEISIDTIRDQCAITLPITTLDQRLVTIYVEKRTDDFYLVHDGGKTVSELFSLGIHLTDNKAELFSRMAKSLGIGFGDRLFQTGCKVGGLQQAIITVAQCQVLAMTDVLQQKPTLEDESMTSRVRRTLDEWKPKYINKIEPNITVKGKHDKHRFDFVSYPKPKPPHSTVAIKILAPRHSSIWQADRYGFFVLDIEKTLYAKWKKLALVTKSESWSESALKLVSQLSDETISVESGEEEQIERILPKTMTQLSKAS